MIATAGNACRPLRQKPHRSLTRVGQNLPLRGKRRQVGADRFDSNSLFIIAPARALLSRDPGTTPHSMVAYSSPSVKRQSVPPSLRPAINMAGLFHENHGGYS